MINEPESGAGGGGGGGGSGGEDDLFGEPGVIHVTPQDKEAIERVSDVTPWRFRIMILYLPILLSEEMVSSFL